MLDEENISYEKLQVEQYVTDLHDYWKDNRTVFKLDSVSFLYIWGNYNRVFDKLYVFYCVVSGNLLHTFYFRSGKKCCCTVICGHGNFYWIVSSWFGKNGFERERSFMIQILYFRNNNKILFFPRLL